MIILRLLLIEGNKEPVGGSSVVPSKSFRIPAFFHDRYKDPIDGKYQDATAAILAGLGSELEADVELSGCSLESESELGQEKVQPIMEESGTKSGSNEEGIDASDEVRTDVSDRKAQMAQTRRAQTRWSKKAQICWSKKAQICWSKKAQMRRSKKAQTARAERTY